MDERIAIGHCVACKCSVYSHEEIYLRGSSSSVTRHKKCSYRVLLYERDLTKEWEALWNIAEKEVNVKSAIDTVWELWK